MNNCSADLQIRRGQRFAPMPDRSTLIPALLGSDAEASAGDLGFGLNLRKAGLRVGAIAGDRPRLGELYITWIFRPKHCRSLEISRLPGDDRIAERLRQDLRWRSGPHTIW
jgi:hypothetical protein